VVGAVALSRAEGRPPVDALEDGIRLSID
jgi:hypothetical protein